MLCLFTQFASIHCSCRESLSQERLDKSHSRNPFDNITHRFTGQVRKFVTPLSGQLILVIHNRFSQVLRNRIPKGIQLITENGPGFYLFRRRRNGEGAGMESCI